MTPNKSPRPTRPPAHSLTEVAAQLPGAHRTAKEVTLTGLTLASADVRPGDLFVALPGARAHGAQYAPQALEHGAAAVLTDQAGQALIDPSVPVIVAEDLRQRLGELSAWFYDHPARSLKLAGVTGTNGKTTTCHLLAEALAHAWGEVALLGTIAARIGTEAIPSARTTAEAPALQAMLALMRERGVRACAMEVSSHALAQHRVDGLCFDVAGFTNLSRDHLDYHGSMDAYFEAKAALFTPAHAAQGVIYLADEWSTRLAATAAVPCWTLGQDPAATWRVTDQQAQGGKSVFTLRGPQGENLACSVRLPGAYNIANAALAIVIAIGLGVEPAVAAQGVAQVDAVPGRMQVIELPGAGPLVVVDYAHSPSSVAAVLEALRPHTGAGPLVAVLGAGGDRDAGKREQMGTQAAQGADLVIVTDDNPRTEDPAIIRQAVLNGAACGPARVREVPNRAEAIALALDLAGAQGVVAILGKGHERTIDYGSTAVEHSDVDTVRQLWKGRAP
jgi:UDP-N-acetylmuramoyl-L-alanyl-D-glutamate--2,6-diaminopimelate ligase